MKNEGRVIFMKIFGFFNMVRLNLSFLEELFFFLFENDGFELRRNLLNDNINRVVVSI